MNFDREIPAFIQDDFIDISNREASACGTESATSRKQTSILIEPKIEERFYRSLDADEFGISRTVADKLYHLPKLLTQPVLEWQTGTTTYIIKSSTPDSFGNSIVLEHRLQASSHEEAEKIASIIADRLKGVLHKILMATWKLANELRKFTFSCQLTDLMKLCYPDRKAAFQNHEKIEFFEHLRSLENTKIVYTRNKAAKGRKASLTQSIEIRLIEIHHKIGKKEEYPQSLTLTVLNAPALQKEKLAFVGAAFKNSTLELHADDISLAAWLQARKAQLKEGKSNVITVQEDYLLKVAGLEKTAKTNKSHARKKLRDKLDRYAQQGIIETPVEKQGPNLLVRFRKASV